MTEVKQIGICRHLLAQIERGHEYAKQTLPLAVAKLCGVPEHSALAAAQGEGWATPTVLAALRLAQRATCTYFGPTCDCKYGASGKGEQTGCPELRTLIAKAEAALTPPPKAEGHNG